MWSEIGHGLGVSCSGEITLISTLAISLRQIFLDHADLQPRATVSSLKAGGGV